MEKENNTGLTTTQAKKRQEEHGLNEIENKGVSSLLRLSKKFIGPIPLMIEAALILSALSGRWEDFVIIAVLLGVNIGVDFFQEQKAHTALAALRSTLSPQAVVKRDGVFVTMPAKELVVGDVIKLILGDIVPADARLNDGEALQIDQATITGESLPVLKNSGEELYASSIVQRGSAFATVTTIGKDTFIGNSAQLVTKAELGEESHFQQAVFAIGKFLMIIAVILIAITFIVLLYRGDGLLETMRFSLVLAVASIPVALPAVLSVTMAIGARTLAAKRAIVSHFTAIEELAGVDRLCVDKTGTLTKNEIAVVTPKVYGHFTIADLFTYGILASETEHKTKIEKSIFSYTREQSITTTVSDYTIKTFVPFNPIDKFTKVVVRTEEKIAEIIMGAPQVILSDLKFGDDKKHMLEDVEQLAQKGLRALAVISNENGKWNAVGIFPLLDPPRDDSKAVIAEIKQEGVFIKMITGDNSLIAKHIAGVLSIGSRLVSVATLHALHKSSDRKTEYDTIEETDVFSEVTPEDKYNIVSALQKSGHIVAMTGDGVNDAPALKQADVGIAVSGASPAARAAADIVLLDSGLHIIKEAIESARAIFARMQSYATFRIALTIRILFFITIAILLFNEAPITAAMIILLALLNDIPVMTIAYDNAVPSTTPVRWRLKETIFIASLLGLSGLVSSLLLLWWLHGVGIPFVIIQTIIFLKLDVAGHSTLYLTRTGRKHFWQRPYPALKFFIPAFSSRIIGTIIALFGIMMAAISLKVVIIIWIYATLWFLLNDQIKVYGYKVFDYFSKKAETQYGGNSLPTRS